MASSDLQFTLTASSLFFQWWHKTKPPREVLDHPGQGAGYLVSRPSSLEPIHAGVTGQFQNILFPLPHARFLLFPENGFPPVLYRLLASLRTSNCNMHYTSRAQQGLCGGWIRSLLYWESLFKIAMSSKGMKVARGRQKLHTHGPEDVGKERGETDDKGEEAGKRE